jgi:hypothetical protein
VRRRNIGVMVSVDRGQDQLIPMRRTGCRPTAVMIEDQMEAQSQCANSGRHPKDEQHQNKPSLTNRTRHRGIVTNGDRTVNRTFRSGTRSEPTSC